MKNLVKNLRSGFTALLITLISWSVSAGNSAGEKSIFDLMNYQEVVNLTLETDLSTLKADRQNTDSHQAKISFKDAAGREQNWELKVELRGAFRRIKCTNVPPLKLNFKKSQLADAGLAKFDDLKLVPQCISEPMVAKEMLLKEYLAYKLYNEMSDYSFRVQLLRITYIDTATGDKDRQWAFLIEDAAQLRSRLGAEKMDEKFNLPADSFHLSQARIVAVFEYMIGNTDWSFNNVRNMKFLRKKGKIIPVPYDFDFSGMVDANYAVPNTSIGQSNVAERVYLGFENDPGMLHSTIYHLVGKREKFENIVMEFKPLSYSNRLEVVAYLKSFFDAPEQVRMKEWAVQELRESMAADR